MPMFEYRCRQCNHVSTFLEAPGRKAAHPCEKCGSRSTEKMLSSFAAQAGRSGGSRCQTCPDSKCPMSRA